MTRRELMLVGAAGFSGVFYAFRRSLTGARRWFVTNRRPPNEIEQRHVQYFDGDALDAADDAAMIEMFREVLRSARAELAQRPDYNVWRIGQLTLRFRIGKAETSTEYAMISRDEATDGWPRHSPRGPEPLSQVLVLHGELGLPAPIHSSIS